MPDINGIPYVESSDLVSAYPAASQALAQEVSDQLASKLPYSYGTATPTTSDEGFLWYDENDTPPTPKFWDGAAFQALTSGKILQVVRATDSTNRTTTSGTFVDASLSVTISPQKSDSAVLLLWSFQGLILTASGAVAAYQITDNSNNALTGSEGTELGGGTNLKTQMTLMGYSTPATTSATTYKARFRLASGSGTTYAENQKSTGQLYALEIAA